MATTPHLATKYLSEKRAAGMISQPTEIRHRRLLTTFAEMCPRDPARITKRDIVRWMRTIERLDAGTQRVYHSTVRGFVKWLRREGKLARNPFLGFPMPKAPRPAHRALDASQVVALIAACETRRERTLILLALHSGLRRAELAALELGDVSLAARTLRVREGKGGQTRTVPLSEEAARVLGGYISAEGLSAGPLFRSEVSPNSGISPQTVWRIFNQVAVRSGVKVRAGDGVATHAARHTCATDTHRACHDVEAVRAILGHKNLNTTQIYVEGLGIEALRQAVEGRAYLNGVA